MSGGTENNSALERAFACGGEAGACARAVDWASTPLGPIESWPHSLRAAASLVLGHGFAMNVSWGRDLCQIYNDATIPIMGRKHPTAMGQPVAETWAEIWEYLEPVLREVWQTGRPRTIRSNRFLIDRNGFLEEMFVDITYSVVRDDHGDVGGILSTSIEVTDRVLGERRLRTLRALDAAALSASSDAEVFRSAMDTLGQNPHDIPFAALYALEQGSAVRVGATGIHEGGHDFPARVELGEESVSDAGWPLSRALIAGEGALVEDLEARFGGRFGPVRAALVLPARWEAQQPPYGALVVGLSPHLILDEAYQSFLELVARGIAVSLAGIRAVEEAREQATKLAESQLKDAFLGLAAHELNTPLTSLKLRIQLVARQLCQFGTVDAQILTNAQRAIDRMERLIGDLVSVAALRDKRMKLARARHELGEICQQAVDAQAIAPRDAVAVEVPGAPVLAIVDAPRIAQALGSLLSNALKFSPADKRVTLTLTTTDRREAKICVRDEGPGIDEASARRLFERFYRVPGIEVQRGSQVGLGLGLYLTKSIVDEHGGRIWVETQPGVGSAFYFTLPLG